MRVQQQIWKKDTGWKTSTNDDLTDNANLVILFGHGEYFNSAECFNDVKNMYAKSIIIGCSTSGSILGEQLYDNNVILSAIEFEKTTFELAYEDLLSSDDSFEAGKKLSAKLNKNNLKHILVLSDGLEINGSKLASGLNAGCNNAITISGGLAGDGFDFSKTYVIANESAKSNRVAAIGFYGDAIDIKVGCYSGWDEFGTERVITKSLNNILYEIDNSPALELYKSYLGDEAKDLPGSGLRFPLSIRSQDEESIIIRTLLAIDDKDNSMIFAGDLPEGAICRLMKANIDKLVDNAELAANDAKTENDKPALSIAVSCVGRRAVLGQLTEDELEAVKSQLSKQNMVTGFYSYGEIAPHHGIKDCKLHNQTMTITTISENA